MHSPVKIFTAYATSSEMIPKEFPEMLEKQQHTGMSIWLPGGNHLDGVIAPLGV